MLSLEEGRLKVLGRGWRGGSCWSGCVPLGKATPATLRLLLQAGKLRPKDPLPTAGVRGFAGGHRGFLGHQPIRAKPVPRHRGVPHRGASWPRVPGGIYVCTAVDSEGWSRGLAVEALPSPEQSQTRQYPAPGGHGHPSLPALEWEQGVQVTTGQRPGRHSPSLPIPLGQHRMELSRSPRGLEARATLLCLHVLEPWVSL